jgi:polyisoprenoid-binding protein YceI
MKKLLMRILILLFIFSTHLANAQNVLQSNVEKSDLVVKGTSSLHDWNMISDKFNCSVIIKRGEEKVLIESVSFKLSSTSLTSDNSIMDKKAWDALKTEEFKSIQFVSNEQIELHRESKNLIGEIDGELNLSGIKKKVTVPYKGELDDLGNLNISGEISLKMSEFGIVPPTALMGTIKTGDVVTVSFQVVFDQVSLVSENK